jgi:hypothetical protein
MGTLESRAQAHCAEFARNSHAFNPIGGKTVMLAPGPAHRDGVFISQRKRIGCV